MTNDDPDFGCRWSNSEKETRNDSDSGDDIDEELELVVQRKSSSSKNAVQYLQSLHCPKRSQTRHLPQKHHLWTPCKKAVVRTSTAQN